jgi:hypothetical protein
VDANPADDQSEEHVISVGQLKERNCKRRHRGQPNPFRGQRSLRVRAAEAANPSTDLL